jgi:hypothetical protein
MDDGKNIPYSIAGHRLWRELIDQKSKISYPRH